MPEQVSPAVVAGRQKPEVWGCAQCAQLGRTCCTLPLEVRPLVCRLFPYEYTAAGITGVAGDCPTAVVPSGSTLLRVLDTRAGEAMRWHHALCAE